MLFFEKLEQKRLYVIITFIIAIAVAAAYSFMFVNKEYVSTSIVMLMKVQDEKNYSNMELSDSLVSTLDEIIKSEKILDGISDKDNVKKITLNRVKKSDALKVSITSNTVEKSIELNNKVIEVFNSNVKQVYKDTVIYKVDEAKITKTSYGLQIVNIIIVTALVYIAVILAYITLIIKLDKKIKSKEDLELELSLKELIRIPLINSKKKKIENEIIDINDNKSNVTRAFDKLRSNIQFLNVNNKDKNIIMVTSANKEEGKSYISANIAASFAKVGKKVVIIDADMLSGRQDKIFNIPNNLGFSNFLSGLDNNGIEINELINKYINETEIKNLNLITSGTVPPNPAELLTSAKLSELIKDLTVFYDVVVIDTTSVLTSTDPLILARIATSTILVSTYRKTNKDDMYKTKRDLTNVGGRIIGVVVNKTKIKVKKDIKTNCKLFGKKVKDKLDDIIQKIKELLLNSNEIKLLEDGSQNKITTVTMVDHEKESVVPDTIVEEVKDEEVKEEIDKTNFFYNITNTVKAKFVSLISDKELPDEKNNEQLQEQIQEDIKEAEEKVDNSRESVNVVMEENTVTANTSKITVKEKFGVVLVTVKTFFENIGNKIKTTYQKISQYISEKYKTVKEDLSYLKKNEESENEQLEISENMTSENVINQINTNPDKKLIDDIENSKKNPDEIHYEVSEEGVLVIVDSENGYCRAFSKYCFTEKLARGIDRTDGFMKAYYSASYASRIRKELMDAYDLDDYQLKRVDPLIYKTLIDYDECVWIEKKIVSHKAESYVFAMVKEFEILPDETKKEYELRARRLRRAELIKNDIDLEYKLDKILTKGRTRITDKLSMKKYAGLYEISVDNKSVSEKKKSEENKKFYSYVSNKIKNFSSKSKAEETTEEVENKNPDQLNFDDLAKQEEDKIKEEAKRIKEEKRLENEQRRKERKIERQLKRQEKKEERQRKAEELKKMRAAAKVKLREEARIEEELQEDNLYPKTKYNKDI